MNKRVYVLILKLIGFILAVPVVIWLLMFCLSPVYDFPPQKPFTGALWYNPYSSLANTCVDSTCCAHTTSLPAAWRRCNFHTHSNAWGFMANGRKNTAQEVRQAYKTMDYDILGISDYFHIEPQLLDPENPANDTLNPFPVPVYEQGLNIFKTHHLVFGRGKELRRDLLLFQTSSNKQWIINQILERCDLMALAHPAWGGYTISDVQKLSGYPLFETLNDWRNSPKHWDAALSAGRAAFIIASDDSHDVFRMTNVGRKVTQVYLPGKIDLEAIEQALYRGQAYGLEVTQESANEPLEAKRRRLDSYPVLRSVSVLADTLVIALTDTAQAFTFIGQNGDTLATAPAGERAVYPLAQAQSYVRCTITLADGTRLWLNPVLRTEDGRRPDLVSAKIALRLSICKWILCVAVLTGAVIVLRRSRHTKNQTSNEKIF